jgi:hypothetical protein
MNHVPDDALDAIDDLGRALLVGDPKEVDERLRSDLRLRIDCDRAGLPAGTVRVAFRLEHGSPEATLRDHGPFLETIVDGVETRLRVWGIDPPEAYTHRETDGEWQVYAGRTTRP